jgi:acyl CoA:acetate/3-ketoacid CoA transferase beta subunit
MIITELGVFEMDRAKRRYTLTEIAPGVTVDEVKGKTEAEFLVASSLVTMS